MIVPIYEKRIFITILTVILTVLISHTICSRFISKEGFDPLGIGKIFKILLKIADFFCWLGDVVVWVGNAVVAILYYIGNIFNGCILYYVFDMIVGAAYYLLFIGFSLAGQSEVFKESIGLLSEWRTSFDDMLNDSVGFKAFSYSKETTSKCYKYKVGEFPKWPF